MRVKILIYGTDTLYMIEKELNKIPNAKAQQIARENVEAIKSSNRRDFRF